LVGQDYPAIDIVKNSFQATESSHAITTIKRTTFAVYARGGRSMEAGSPDGGKAGLCWTRNEIRSANRSMGGFGAIDGEQQRQRSSGKSVVRA